MVSLFHIIFHGNFIFKFSITGKKYSFPIFDPNIWMKFTWTNWNFYFSLFKTWTICQAALLMFLVLNLNGMKTLMGFISQHVGVCGTQKLKLPSLMISRPVRWVCVQMYSGDQLGGLGTPAGMFGSPKGFPICVLGWPSLRSGHLSYNCLGAQRAPWSFP